jgi:ABC-2 type transport system ATP-binding protein
MSKNPFKTNSKPYLDEGLRVDRISHYFGNHRALRSVSFDAKRGEVCAILGPNGAGKTTLLRLISGYFLPTEGHVWFGKKELTRQPVQVKKLLGYLPEHFPLYPYLTIKEFLSWCLALRGFRGRKRDEIHRVLRLVDLPGSGKHLIQSLSKGYRQRLSIAQALLGDPPYLILDEPTSGMDPRQIRHMRELIIRLKGERTIVLSTHILAEASQVSDYIVILSEGRIIASGSPGELHKAYLHGETVYRIMVRGAQSQVENQLKQLSRLTGFQMISALENSLQFELRFEPETTDEGILDSLDQAGLRPLEFYRKELKLEDIFLKAVTQEPLP